MRAFCDHQVLLDVVDWLPCIQHLSLVSVNPFSNIADAFVAIRALPWHFAGHKASMGSTQVACKWVAKLDYHCVGYSAKNE